MNRVLTWQRFLFLALMGGLALSLACAGGRKLSEIEKADRDYEKGNYTSAIEGYRIYLEGGTAGLQSMQAQFRLGRSYYENEDYPTAAVEFEIFQRDFPRSDSLYAAAYWEAMCWAAQSPRYDRDSSITEKGLRMMEEFRLDYPGTHYDDESLAAILELKNKLARKDIETARFYRTVNRAQAAYVYFEMVYRRYPESDYVEEALLGALAMKLRTRDEVGAREIYDSIVATYPDTKTAEEARDLIEGKRKP